MRLIHLMALVAAVAMTLTVPPALMPVVRSMSSGAGTGERLNDQISLALILWSPILAMFAVSGDRSRLRRVSRSYGTSALLASSSALLLLLIHNLVSAFHDYRRRGISPFPESWLWEVGSGYYCPAAADIVHEAPKSVACAIVAVWLILAMTGAGRRSSNWLERFYLLFGLFWVSWYFRREFMLPLRW